MGVWGFGGFWLRGLEQCGKGGVRDFAWGVEGEGTRDWGNFS